MSQVQILSPLPNFPIKYKIMRPQIVVYSLIGLLLLSASFFRADAVEGDRSTQESVSKDSKIQQPPAEAPVCEEPEVKDAGTGKTSKITPSDQAVMDDMQSEFNRMRERTWDDRYRH